MNVTSHWLSVSAQLAAIVAGTFFAIVVVLSFLDWGDDDAG